MKSKTTPHANQDSEPKLFEKIKKAVLDNNYSEAIKIGDRAIELEYPSARIFWMISIAKAMLNDMVGAFYAKKVYLNIKDEHPYYGTITENLNSKSQIAWDKLDSFENKYIEYDTHEKLSQFRMEGKESRVKQLAEEYYNRKPNSPFAAEEYMDDSDGYKIINFVNKYLERVDFPGLLFLFRAIGKMETCDFKGAEEDLDLHYKLMPMHAWAIKIRIELAIHTRNFDIAFKWMKKHLEITEDKDFYEKYKVIIEVEQTLLREEGSKSSVLKMFAINERLNVRNVNLQELLKKRNTISNSSVKTHADSNKVIIKKIIDTVFKGKAIKGKIFGPKAKLLDILAKEKGININDKALRKYLSDLGYTKPRTKE